MEPVPAALLNLNYQKLEDPVTYRAARGYLEAADYELVLPCQRVEPGDEFLGGGAIWTLITEALIDSTYAGGIRKDHYIIRRATEHRRMQEFFFGRQKRRK